MPKAASASRCAVRERLRQFVGRANDAHAAAAAAVAGLDDDRVAEVGGDLLGLLLGLDGAVAAGQRADTRLLHRPAGARLLAHQADHRRARADELDVAGLAHLGEVGALGEEAVAGVDGIGAGDLGGADDGGHVQVALAAARRTDADVLVGEADVQAVLVGLGLDGDRLDAQFPAGADDAQRDLAAIGNQDLLEHAGPRASERGRRTAARRTARAGRSPRRSGRSRRRTPRRSRSSASWPR